MRIFLRTVRKVIQVKIPSAGQIEVLRDFLTISEDKGELETR